MKTSNATIVFLSDFGTSDPYTGIVKGVIRGINPEAVVIDLTHGVPPQDITAASLILAGSFSYFPAGSIFLAVVDPGVGSDRNAMIVSTDQYHFVLPDNGIVTGVLRKWSGEPEIHAIKNSDLVAKEISSTFHARDIFGPAAAHLSLGVPAEEFGPKINSPVLAEWPDPKVSKDVVRGEVIYIDGFGNLITNVPAEAIPAPLHQWQCFIRCSDGDIQLPVKHTYSDVEPGSGVSLCGSFGLMEVSINSGNAAEKYGISRGCDIEFRLKQGK